MREPGEEGAIIAGSKSILGFNPVRKAALSERSASLKEAAEELVEELRNMENGQERKSD